MIVVSWIGVVGGEVACISLNRPDKKNAMTPEMLEGFCAAVDETKDRARAVIVRGAGDVFCSGFDLSLCLQDQGVLADLLRGLSRAIRALRDHPSPVVVAVQGAAIAGGCALLGGADVVITHDDAKLGYPVLRLGISPAVSAPFLMQSMGPGAARTRMLDTQLVSGRDALRLGLVHESLAAAVEVPLRAEAVATELALKPRSGMEATKRLMNELDGSKDVERIDNALSASLGLVGLPEESERLGKMFRR